MKNEINLIETDTDVERACVAALLNERINDRMHTTAQEDDHPNNGIDTDVMITIFENEIKELILGEGDRIYAECTQSKFQAEIEETLVDMLQIGNSAAWNGIKMAPAQFRKMKMIKLLSRGAADDVMSECF